MSDANKAVFLSYASQDAEAAKRIADALRAAGVEVWFDQSELVGGDAWDAKIRGQISSCALFVPIISANTQARREGYFRIEWKLAAQRTYAMSDDTAFLLPVVIDDTKDAVAKVPAEFKVVQWTRLPLRPAHAGPADETLAVFCRRMKKLLEEESFDHAQVRPGAGGVEPGSVASAPRRAGGTHSKGWWALPIFGVMMALFLVMKEGRKESPPAPAPAPSVAPQSEARQLVAKVWVLLNKPEMARAELDAADALCKRAAALDPTDAEVWAAWSQVNVWYCFHNLDRSAPRQEAAREYASRAMQLDSKSYEARLAQAFYWVRGDASGRRWGEAQSLLRELLRERPDEPRVLFTLGYGLIHTPETETEGVAMLERLARNPGFAAVAWDEIGWAAYFKRDWKKAEAAVARSLAAQPYWNNLGLKITLAERVHGDMDLAESTLKQMPASALQEDWGIGFACEVYQWRREPLRTIEVLEGVSRDWIHYYFYDYPKAYLLGEARLMAKQASAARRDFQRARVLIEKQLTDDPNNGYLLGLQARTLLHLDEREEAEKSYRLLKELGGTDYVQLFLAPPEAGIAFIRSMTEASQSDIIGRTFFSAASLRLDPQFDRLRSEPAFQALLSQLDAENKSATPAAITSVPDVKSVAVLAFTNLSDDKANEYFSDGISEELLNVLAKIPGLKVSARTSAFYFKGKEVPIPEIAQKLGVAYVVEGSVRKSGDKVRITAQLIKAADGFHVWSETFPRDLKDVFAVQDEIAGLIAKNLELKIGTSAPALAVNPEAFDLYLQGRQAWNRRTSEGYVRAEELFQRALQLEPNFARAHAGLADVWMLRALEQGKIGNFGQRAAPEILRVVEEIQKALALDPDSCEAHASLGFARWLQWQQAEAERELRRSVALNSNYATGHHWLGGVLMIGSLDECLAEGKRAVELDPLSHRIIDNYGSSLVLVGRVEEGLAAFERAISLQPGASQSITSKALALITLGRRDEALLLAKELSGEWRQQVLIAAGMKTEAEAALIGASGWQRFALLTTLGRYDEALAGLNAADVPITGIAQWLMDPDLDPYRRDPRFVKLLAELKLTEAHSRQQAWRAAHPPENSKAGK